MRFFLRQQNQTEVHGLHRITVDKGSGVLRFGRQEHLSGKHERNSIPHEQKTLIGRSIEPIENITLPIGPVTLARIVIEELRISNAVVGSVFRYSFHRPTSFPIIVADT